MSLRALALLIPIALGSCTADLGPSNRPAAGTITNEDAPVPGRARLKEWFRFPTQWSAGGLIVPERSFSVGDDLIVPFGDAFSIEVAEISMSSPSLKRVVPLFRDTVPEGFWIVPGKPVRVVYGHFVDCVNPATGYAYESIYIDPGSHVVRVSGSLAALVQFGLYDESDQESLSVLRKEGDKWKRHWTTELPRPPGRKGDRALVDLDCLEDPGGTLVLAALFDGLQLLDYSQDGPPVATLISSGRPVACRLVSGHAAPIAVWAGQGGELGVWTLGRGHRWRVRTEIAALDAVPTDSGLVVALRTADGEIHAGTWDPEGGLTLSAVGVRARSGPELVSRNGTCHVVLGSDREIEIFILEEPK